MYFLVNISKLIFTPAYDILRRVICSWLLLVLNYANKKGAETGRTGEEEKMCRHFVGWV